MKITQSWKRNTPTTDGYSLTVTYVYSSQYLHEIEEVEKKLPKGTVVMEKAIGEMNRPGQPKEEK